MVHELDTEEYQEKSALYALGALSQHEARSFERHLAEGCHSCEGDRVQFEEVVGTLGLDSPAAAPSVYLRDMLLARIEREVQIAPPSTGLTQMPESRQPSVSRQAAPSRVSLGRVVLPWAVAASLAIAVLASLFALGLAGREADSLRAQLADIQVRTSKLEAETARAVGLARELTQINEVLVSPGHREIALAGQPDAPPSSGKVYWDVQKNRWVVTADLPPAPKGKVYQLWFITADKQAISAGLIASDESGHGFTTTNVPANIGSIAAAGITLEPKGGSKQPTRPIYALGTAG